MGKVTAISSRPQYGLGAPLSPALAGKKQSQLATAFKNAEPSVQVLRQGETLEESADRLVIVKSGCLKRTRLDAAGDAHINAFFLIGDVVIFGNGVDHCSLISACDLACVEILDRQSKSDIFASEVSASLLRGMRQDLERSNTLAFYVSQKSAKVRLAWFLDMLAKRSLQTKNDSNCVEFNMPMSRSDISSHLGIAPETVSRELTRLDRDGVIDVQRRYVQICKLDQLAKKAEIESNIASKSRAMH